jgi:hypothetical protein
MTSQDGPGRAERENEGKNEGKARDASGGVLRGPAVPAAYV